MDQDSELQKQAAETEPKHCFKCGNYHVENQCTTFVQSFYWDHGGQQVYLVGDWSSWQKKQTMIKMDGYFQTQISLNPGIYQYKYIVDGDWKYNQNQPAMLDAENKYNNVREVHPKRAYLDQHNVSKYETNQTLVEIDLESSLLDQGLKVMGSWDDWNTEQSLHLKTNILKNCEVNSIKITLQKNKRYQFKFKNSQGEYFIDKSYPAVINQKGVLNNYIVTSFAQVETPLTPQVVLKEISRRSSTKQTNWEWEKQNFENLPNYNLYGHSLTCIGQIIYIFGGIYKSQFRDYLIKIPLCDLSQFCMEKVDIPPRAYHNSVANGDKILIFGGMNTSVLNDSHIYNTATNEWSQSVMVVGNAPSNRQKSTSVLYKDTVILYGGYFCCPKTGTEVIYNDIHVLDTQYMTWKKLELQKNQESPSRFAHSANIYGDQMLVFGGIGSMKQDGNTNQLWKLKIQKENLCWSLAETSGTPPSPRHGHTGNILSHYLIIFGGGDHNQLFNDVKMLDLNVMEWIIPNIYGQIPRAVIYHGAISVGNQLIVIGGKTSGGKQQTSVLILKPKSERRKSFSTLSPNFQQESGYSFY